MTFRFEIKTANILYKKPNTKQKEKTPRKKMKTISYMRDKGRRISWLSTDKTSAPFSNTLTILEMAVSWGTGSEWKTLDQREADILYLEEKKRQTARVLCEWFQNNLWSYPSSGGWIQKVITEASSYRFEVFDLRQYFLSLFWGESMVVKIKFVKISSWNR